MQVLAPEGDAVPALVEFATTGESSKAMAALQGRDIYDNCCTLRITKAHMESIVVHENSARAADFTNPRLPSNPTLDVGTVSAWRQRYCCRYIYEQHGERCLCLL